MRTQRLQRLHRCRHRRPNRLVVVRIDHVVTVCRIPRPAGLNTGTAPLRGARTQVPCVQRTVWLQLVTTAGSLALAARTRAAPRACAQVPVQSASERLRHRAGAGHRFLHRSAVVSHRGCRTVSHLTSTILSGTSQRPSTQPYLRYSSHGTRVCCTCGFGKAGWLRGPSLRVVLNVRAFVTGHGACIDHCNAWVRDACYQQLPA